MKKIAILISVLFISLSGFGQSDLIPERNWKLVQDYLSQKKEFSGILLLGAEGKIKINLGSGFAAQQNKIYRFRLSGATHQEQFRADGGHDYGLSGTNPPLNHHHEAKPEPWKVQKNRWSWQQQQRTMIT